MHAPVESEKKIAVVDYDEIGSAESVEFVVGVGVAQRQQDFGAKVDKAVESAFAKKGYSGISPDEVFIDCLEDTSKFQAADLLGSAFPAYARSNRTFIPIFRYLNAAGIRSEEDLAKSNYEGAKKVVEKLRKADYTLPSYAGRYRSSFVRLSTKAIIQKASDPAEALLMVAFQPVADIDRQELRQFLRDNLGSFEPEPYRTAYRKAVCLVDRLMYGF